MNYGHINTQVPGDNEMMSTHYSPPRGLYKTAGTGNPPEKPELQTLPSTDIHGRRKCGKPAVNNFFEARQNRGPDDNRREGELPVFNFGFLESEARLMTRR